MMLAFNKKRRTKYRRKGFSLIFVLSVGGFAALMAFAIMAPLLPIYKFVASQDYEGRASNLAETAMQYALATIQNAASNDQLDSISSPILVPAILVQNQNIQVAFEKYSGNHTALNESAAYNPLNSWLDLPSASRPVEDYRLLTVSTIVNGRKSTIQVLIAPDLISNSTTPNTPFFQNALFGKNSISLADGVSLNSVDGNYSTNLLNTKGNLSLGNGNILGSVSANSVNAKSNPGTIAGDLHSSTNVDTNVFIRDGDISSGKPPNVLHDGDATNGNGVIDNTVENSTVAPAPIKNPTQPVSFQNPDQVETLTANSQPSNIVQDLGNVNVGGDSPTKTLNLPPGNYSADSINIDSGGSLQVMPPSDSSGPQSVNIYVQDRGTNTSSFAVNVNGNLTNSATNGFQLFYNGQKTVSLNTPNFKGLVYAPNAPLNITVRPTGSFTGALSGNQVAVSGTGQVTYDPSASDFSTGNAPGYFKPGANSKPSAFRIVSWREL